MSKTILRAGIALLMCLCLVAGHAANRATAAGTQRPAGDGTPIRGTVPWSITEGPDHTIWFVEMNRDNHTAVARIAPNGRITTFPVPAASHAQHALILGPDGHLWLAAPGAIGRLSSTGHLTSFRLPSHNLDPGSLAVGPEGNLWFATDRTVGRMTLSGKVTLFPLAGAGSSIVAGADGNLWCIETQSDQGSNTKTQIDRLTTAGRLRVFHLPKGSQIPGLLAAAPGGTIWFTTSNGDNSWIGTIRPSGDIGQYPLATNTIPTVLTVASSGTVWVGGVALHGQYFGVFIDRVTPKGAITPIAAHGITSYPGSLLVLGDGTLWFTEGNNEPNEYVPEGFDRVGRITASGVGSEFILPTPQGVISLPATGLDGSLWFCEPLVNKIGRVAPDGHLTDYLIPTVHSDPGDITAGPDGNFWFTENATAQVGRITPTGQITEFQLPGYEYAYGIATGADGNLWITASSSTSGDILIRLTRQGQIVGRRPGQTSTPSYSSTPSNQPVGEERLNADPTTIVVGTHHDLWLIDSRSNSIGHQGLKGAYKEYLLPSNGAAVSGIAIGPDGNLWFTESYGNRVGYLTPSGLFREFSLGATYRGPEGISAGPDGAVWFTEATGGFGRMTTTGKLTEFAGPPGDAPESLIAGPAGSLWFTGSDHLSTGRITTQGKVTIFRSALTSSYPTEITAGPDGNLWVTLQGRDAVGRIGKNGQTTVLPLPSTESGPGGITAGPDGNLWITVPGSNMIDRMTPSGVVTPFHIAGRNTAPSSITAGANHTLWFVEPASSTIGRLTAVAASHVSYKMPNTDWFPIAIGAGPDGNAWFLAGIREIGFNGLGIARITPGGAITLFKIPTDDPYKRFGKGLDTLSGAHIVAGPDGNMWYTNPSTNSIGRITPNGKATEFALPTAACFPSGITAGADGNLWFVEHAANKVGRISLTGKISEFIVSPAYHDLTNIAAGPGGTLWVTEPAVNQVARITTSGKVSEFVIPAAVTGSGPSAATAAQ